MAYFWIKFCRPLWYSIPPFQKIFSGDVYSFLKSKGIPIISLTKNINSEESLVKIKDMNPDLLVSIAGNEIFKKI